MTARLLLVAALMAAVPAAGGWRGADVSSLPQVEAGGGVFRDGGEPGDALEILAAHGVDLVRLRLWHAPPDGVCGLTSTLALARRAHAAGLSILLDLHYSDTWADPGHQTKPAAWAALPFPILADSVRTYTRDVTAALNAQGTPPALVQTGNEITAGMLWDDGRVGGRFDTPAQWTRLALLLTAAADGLVEACAPAPRPPIVLHVDRGGDNAGARRVCDALIAREAPFEVIGLSFYPWWHGGLEAFEANVDDLVERYDRDVLLVETAYPWTLGWFDDTHNPVGRTDHLLPGYPATPEGQHAFLEAVTGIIDTLPGRRGIGVVYWEPLWIAAPGYGSSWENLAVFDEAGNILPGAWGWAR